MTDAARPDHLGPSRPRTGSADRGGPPLATLAVLDLAIGPDAHCGRILADLGADVVRVEPPSGDPSRTWPPFLDDRVGIERSLTFASLNANKRGVTLDIETALGKALLRQLALKADVLIESYAPGHLAAIGLPHETLMRWNPRLIHVAITPYGQDGPLAGAPASDLEVTAMGGALSLAGEPDRAPVRTTLPQSGYWTGMYGAMGALMAWHARERTGRGQLVDVSGQAAMVTVTPPAPLFWDVLGEEHRRLGPYLLGRSVVGSRFRNIWPCKDGFVAFAIQGGPIGRHTGKKLVEWMKAKGDVPAALASIDWDTFDNQTLRQEEVERLEGAIAPFFLGLTKREFFAGVVERNMLGYPVATAADIVADEQLEARAFWDELPLDGRAARAPGGFAVFDGDRPKIRRGAPRLGEHNAEVFGA